MSERRLVNTGAIAAVAWNTFKESARNRVLYAIVGATVFISLLSWVLAAISGGDDASGLGRRVRIVTNLSLSSIALLGALCAIFLGTNLVYQEVERRTVYTILARPISRTEFIVGKYLGLGSVVSAAVGTMALGFAGLFWVYIALQGGGASLGWKHFVALAFTGVELLVVTGIALLFSAIAHPIEGAIFAFVATLAGHATANLNLFAAEVVRGTETPSLGARALEKLAYVLYVVLPNLENFNFRTEAVDDLPIEGGVLLRALGYAVLYVSILVALTAAAFRRKTL